MKRGVFMPDILSHIFMGYDVLNKLSETNKFKSSARMHPGLFNDSLQGPDPFLYSEIFPWNRSSLSGIGNRMHKEKTGEFLMGMLNDLAICKDCTDMKSACIFGLICHYSMDTICHPYIFFFSGFDYTGQDPEYAAHHKRLETILDILLAEKMLCKAPKLIDRSAFLETSDDVLCAYGDFSKWISHLYGKTISASEILKSLKTMKLSLRLLHDPFGFKKPLFALTDSFLGTKGLCRASVYDTEKIKSIDYANTANKRWRHPVTGEYSNKSFFDLYQDAVSHAVVRISAADSYIKGDLEKSKLEKIFPNLDYDTGLAGNGKMIFQNCLFD